MAPTENCRMSRASDTVTCPSPLTSHASWRTESTVRIPMATWNAYTASNAEIPPAMPPVFCGVIWHVPAVSWVSA